MNNKKQQTGDTLPHPLFIDAIPEIFLKILYDPF